MKSSTHAPTITQVTKPLEFLNRHKLNYRGSEGYFQLRRDRRIHTQPVFLGINAKLREIWCSFSMRNHRCELFFAEVLNNACIPKILPVMFAS